MGIRDDFTYQSGMLYRVNSDRNVIAGQPFGCAVPSGYTEGYYRGKKVGLHRLVYEWHYGPFDGSIDHINSNRSDNRVENLRLATINQNAHNRQLNKNSATGVKGLRASQGAWLCVVAKEGVRHRKTFPLTEEGKQLAIGWLESTRTALHKEFTNHGN